MPTTKIQPVGSSKAHSLHPQPISLQKEIARFIHDWQDTKTQQARENATQAEQILDVLLNDFHPSVCSKLSERTSPKGGDLPPDRTNKKHSSSSTPSPSPMLQLTKTKLNTGGGETKSTLLRVARQPTALH